MALKSQSNYQNRQRTSSRFISNRQREIIARYLPAWIIVAMILAMVLPRLVASVLDMIFDSISDAPALVISSAGTVIGTGANLVIDVAEAGVSVVVGIGDIHISNPFRHSSGTLAPLFTQEVAHWDSDIVRWAGAYDLDPNLLATVMQIESCGHPTINSYAGAQGLFQVMPFHFADGENMHDPDINARRGASVLSECLRMSNGDAGLAMACYNGGPSVIQRPMNTWLAEPQRYYQWGTGIYADAKSDKSDSGTLDSWLNAGGSVLCDMAANELGLD